MHRESPAALSSKESDRTVTVHTLDLLLFAWHLHLECRIASRSHPDETEYPNLHRCGSRFLSPLIDIFDMNDYAMQCNQFLSVNFGE
jgi:hypothetical protein